MFEQRREIYHLLVWYFCLRLSIDRQLSHRDTHRWARQGFLAQHRCRFDPPASTFQSEFVSRKGRSGSLALCKDHWRKSCRCKLFQDPDSNWEGHQSLWTGDLSKATVECSYSWSIYEPSGTRTDNIAGTDSCNLRFPHRGSCITIA